MQERGRYRGAFLEMVTEEVELPNGHTVAPLDVVRHPGASAVVPFLDDDTVLLIHQYRHAAGGMIYEVPAGKLDPGESRRNVRAARARGGDRATRGSHRAARLDPHDAGLHRRAHPPLRRLRPRDRGGPPRGRRDHRDRRDALLTSAPDGLERRARRRQERARAGSRRAAARASRPCSGRAELGRASGPAGLRSARPTRSASSFLGFRGVDGTIPASLRFSTAWEIPRPVSQPIRSEVRPRSTAPVPRLTRTQCPMWVSIWMDDGSDAV